MADDVTPANPGRNWSALLTPRNIIGAVIVIVALLFIFQNTQRSTFHFLFFEITARRWVLSLSVFAAGFASGFLFARHRAHSNAKG
jgi:uncharacterized integral membrane protein